MIDNFDHGVAGRPARGLAAVADDGAVMDIQGAAFDSEDPDTWGFTQDERRIWGVAAHGGRVYYAVGEKAEIWSVGISQDGAFAGDPRWELTVDAEEDLAVTDIAFDSKGFMYLAQRGETENRFDYSQFADSGDGEVLRYWRESPDDPATESIWVPVPQEYAIGFPEGHRQSAGGIDLQYGYDSQGNFNTNACSDTLVADRRQAARQSCTSPTSSPPAVRSPSTACRSTRRRWSGRRTSRPSAHGSSTSTASSRTPRSRAMSATWRSGVPARAAPATTSGYPIRATIRIRSGRRNSRLRATIHPASTSMRSSTTAPRPGSRPISMSVTLRVSAAIAVKADSRTPGVSVTPLQQTKAPGAPFTIGMSGFFPGETVDVGLCFYKQSDADAGGYYPCCKVVVPLDTPPVSCEP